MSFLPLGARVRMQQRKEYSMDWCLGLKSKVKFYYAGLAGDSHMTSERSSCFFQDFTWPQEAKTHYFSGFSF